MSLLLLCGVVAVRGGPLQPPGPTVHAVAPSWVSQAAGTGTFPAFLMRPDGSTIQVGRAVHQSPARPVSGQPSPTQPSPTQPAPTQSFADGASSVDHLDILLFPDLTERVLAGTSVFVLPTDPRALWATVPRASKQEIAVRAQRLARLLQRQIISILGHPGFTEHYQPVLQSLVAETAEAIRTDPRLDLIDGALNDLLQQDDMDALGAALTPIILPELRQALLNALTPHWGSLGTLFTSGHIDPAPFREAATRIVSNPALQQAILDLISNLAGDERVWQLSALTTDVFLDALTSNPRFDALIAELVNDPRFTDDLRRIEVHITTFTTGVFDLVLGRGARSQTDPLAVQMMRYVLINRLGAVVLLVNDQDLYKVAIDRYRTPILPPPVDQEGAI